MSSEKFVSIDIGGTNTRLASAQTLDNPTLSNRREFRNFHDFEKDYERILEYVDTLSVPIRAIGIAIPGALDSDKSMVIHAGNIPGYVEKPLKKLLGDRYLCEVRMDNDASVAALGEATYGNGKEEDFLFVIWGTGIGGARVTYQEGKPIVSQPDWNEYFKSWEEACGGKNLQKLYGKPAELLNETEWQEVMNRFSREILSFTDKLKPKRIVFGGEISIKQKDRLQTMQLQLQRHFPWKAPILETSTLGKDTGLYGSLALLK